MSTNETGDTGTLNAIDARDPLSYAETPLTEGIKVPGPAIPRKAREGKQDKQDKRKERRAKGTGATVFMGVNLPKELHSRIYRAKAILELRSGKFYGMGRLMSHVITRGLSQVERELSIQDIQDVNDIQDIQDVNGAQG